MSDAGIPALRKLPCCIRSRYTGGTVCQRQASQVGIPALFSNAYWHLNAWVIEIQTREQLKNICPMKHSDFLWTSFAFGHPAANVRVRCSDFSKLHVYAVYSNRHPPSLFGEHCENLWCWTLRKTLKRWWGWLEKRWVTTESGGDKTGAETGGPGGPGDETGDKTAATAGDKRDGGDRWGNVYGRRGVIWIDVRHLCLASIAKFCDGGLCGKRWRDGGNN